MPVRVSSFSRISVIAISLFAVVFLTTMYQVGNSLTASRTLLANYQALKSATTVKFYRTIAQYLQSGDAGLLTPAQQQLSNIDELAKQLNLPTLSQSIEQKTASLRNDINTKYRALGKLSGDPLALVRNAEQSMLSVNHAIAQYAQQSKKINTEEQISYLALSHKISASLNELTNARENYFLGNANLSLIHI